MFAGFLREGGAEVAFTRAGSDGDDQLAFEFAFGGELECGVDVGSGTDADEDAFLQGHLAGGLDSVFALDGDDVVEDLEIEILRDKTGAAPLDLVWAGFDR